jgi:tyrosyl-tRNA synthetase
MRVFQGTIAQLLTNLGQTTSMSEGRRVAIQGAVKINGKTITDLTQIFDFKSSDIIQVGNQTPIFIGNCLPI